MWDCSTSRWQQGESDEALVLAYLRDRLPPKLYQRVEDALHKPKPPEKKKRPKPRPPRFGGWLAD